MDRLFFENLLRYLSDVDEGKGKLSLIQVMLMQYVANSPYPISSFVFLPVSYEANII
jgi:hypothetical protein